MAHTHAHADHAAQFRDRFWLSLALAVPVVAASPMFADLLGYSVPAWAAPVPPVLATVLYLYEGVGFVLPPAAAAVAMSLSTVVVALNAQLLRRVDLRTLPPQSMVES